MIKETRLTLPRLFAIAATRGLLGAGIGLLLADKIPHSRRLPIGAVLLGIGLVSTIPLAFPIVKKLRMPNGHARAPSTASAEGLPAD
jgi:hypothetical protein